MGAPKPRYSHCPSEDHYKPNVCMREETGRPEAVIETTKHLVGILHVAPDHSVLFVWYDYPGFSAVNTLNSVALNSARLAVWGTLSGHGKSCPEGLASRCLTSKKPPKAYLPVVGEA